MTIARLHAIVAVSLLSPALAFGAPPTVAVATCGQVVPDRARAFLAADLDCTGSSEGIVLGKGVRLALDGHALGGAYIGVRCIKGCTLTGPGAISAGGAGVVGAGTITIDGVDLGAAIHAVEGNGLGRIRVKNSVIHDSSHQALTGARGIEVEDSTLTDNGLGISANRVFLRNTTITGGLIGVNSPGLRMVDSAIDTTTGGGNAVDIRTASRPQLKNSSCAGKSVNYNTAVSWGVCALD